MTNQPKPKALPNALYWDDNGRITCGACAGTMLRYTLRTLSGHRALKVSPAERAALAELGHPATCERCGKVGES